MQRSDWSSGPQVHMDRRPGEQKDWAVLHGHAKKSHTSLRGTTAVSSTDCHAALLGEADAPLTYYTFHTIGNETSCSVTTQLHGLRRTSLQLRTPVNKHINKYIIQCRRSYLMLRRHWQVLATTSVLITCNNSIVRYYIIKFSYGNGSTITLRIAR
jgi:hypothetical protein